MPARIINTHDTEANWYSHNRVIKEGTLVSINDFYSTEHDIVCRVESENLVPFPFREKPANYNGITFSYSEGTITATGTATSNIYINLLPKGINLEPGMYSISGSPKISGCLVQAQYDGKWGKIDKGDGATFEVITGLTGMVVQINKGTTVNKAIFKPKLQRGVVISPFTPYISDLSTIKVDVLGANLIPFPFREDSSNYNGITFSYENGTITATGTATNAIYLNLTPANFKLKKGNYAISGCPKIKGCLIQAYYDGAWGKIDVGDGVAFEVTTELTKVLVQINKDTILDNAVFKPMLSVGVSPLTFEPYKKKTYTPTNNGIVTGIKSTPPVMNFFTANDNIILRVGYENWEGFIPKAGEQVIFSPDVSHASPRIKIGDGKTGVNRLPFMTDASLTIIGAVADAGEVGKELKKFLPLAGGNIIGQISKSSNVAAWYDGRDKCLVRGTAVDKNHFFPLFSSKVLNGSFELGGYQDRLLISYVKDTDYDNKANTHTYAYFDEDCVLHGVATRADELRDAGNKNSISIRYSGNNITQATVFPAWNNYKLEPMAAADVRKSINAVDKAGDTITGSLKIENDSVTVYPDSTAKNGYLIRYGVNNENYLMIYGSKKDGERGIYDSTLNRTFINFWNRGEPQFMGLAEKVPKKFLLDNIYPVGSIYINYTATSPASLFGGEWERLSDRFLIGAGNKYGSGYTGGEETHTLTLAEMPKHDHDLRETNNSGNQPSAYCIQTVYNKSNWTAANCSYSGSNVAHNNMPPYLGVYMWRRIK